MEITKALEFNSIKTIRLINKDPLLQKVHINKTGGYGFNTLLESAENGTLTPKEVECLETIHQDVILVSDRHKQLYQEIKIKPDTPRRYGKKQVLAEVKEQGGKATSQQETALEISDLKYLAATLNSRITSDRYKGTNKLTDEKQRIIKAAIRDLKKKLKSI